MGTAEILVRWDTDVGFDMISLDVCEWETCTRGGGREGVALYEG